MLIVCGNASSDNKDRLIEIGTALENEGYIIAYNSSYYNLVIMKELVEKPVEENN